MIIDSLENKRIKNYLKLQQKKYRDLEKMFIIEERHLIEEAIKANSLNTLVVVEDYNNDIEFNNLLNVSRKVMNKLSQNKSDVNYIGICNKIEIEPKEYLRILMLDNIGDPANMGAIIRNAVCFGYDQIILSNDCVDIYHEKSIRASQGAMFKISIIKRDLISEIKSLQKEGFMVVGTALNKSVNINELSTVEKMCFIMGNEGNGIKDEILNLTDQNVIIPIKDFDSLNVAVASGIILYNFGKTK